MCTAMLTSWDGTASSLTEGYTGLSLECLRLRISNSYAYIALNHKDSLYSLHMPGLSPNPKMADLLAAIRRASSSAPSLESLQQVVVEVISRDLAHYSWAGFYMLDLGDPDTLVLGPFVGDPTPHVRIPVTQGICGTAVASGETVIVDDVNADPRYLSCSIKTKSEIVVPIYANGKVIGEIDIDSHDPAAFKSEDRVFLEEVASIVGRYIEERAAGSTAPQSSRAPRP
jgi:L-methionine (R)-S-oxide reductase